MTMKTNNYSALNLYQMTQGKSVSTSLILAIE